LAEGGDGAFMSASGATILVIAILALIWLGIAVAMAIAAAHRFRLAEQVLEAAQANARLLALAPARPLVVRADNTVEVDRQRIVEPPAKGGCSLFSQPAARQPAKFTSWLKCKMARPTGAPS